MRAVAVDLWGLFRPMIPKEQKRQYGVGRPQADLKAVFEAVLWMLQTGVSIALYPAGLCSCLPNLPPLLPMLD